MTLPPGFLRLYGEPRADSPHSLEGTEAPLWGMSVCLWLVPVQDAELKKGLGSEAWLDG